MFCGSCGKEIAAMNKFCPHCGNELSILQSDEEDIQKEDPIKGVIDNKLNLSKESSNNIKNNNTLQKGNSFIKNKGLGIFIIAVLLVIGFSVMNQNSTTVNQAGKDLKNDTTAQNINKSDKEYAEKILIIDKDVDSILKNFDSTRTKYIENTKKNSNDITAMVDALSTFGNSAASTANDLNKINQEIGSLEVPNNMKTKSEAYIRYIRNLINSLNKIRDGANLVSQGMRVRDSKSVDNGSSQVTAGYNDFKSGITNLTEIRSELEKVKNGN